MDSRDKLWQQVRAVVLLTLSLFYLVRLTGLILETQRAARAESQLATAVAEIEAGNHALETAIVTAESDAYVEKWARDERKWAREGDIPLAPVVVTATAPAGQPAEGPEESRWQRFKRWLGR